MTREELVDELADAITDTLDMDWNSSWGAEACLKRLEALGLLPNPKSADLKPCPFCGRSGPTVVGYWPDMNGLNMRVRCTCGVAVGGGVDEATDRAMWNTRATPPKKEQGR